MAFVTAALVDNTVGDRLGGMSSDSTKNFPISEHVYWVYSTYIYINIHAGACTHVYMCTHAHAHTHTHTHTHYPSLQSLLSLRNYLSQRRPSTSNQKLYGAPMFRQIPSSGHSPQPTSRYLGHSRLSESIMGSSSV